MILTNWFPIAIFLFATHRDHNIFALSESKAIPKQHNDSLSNHDSNRDFSWSPLRSKSRIFPAASKANNRQIWPTQNIHTDNEEKSSESDIQTELRDESKNTVASSVSRSRSKDTLASSVSRSKNMVASSVSRSKSKNMVAGSVSRSKSKDMVASSASRSRSRPKDTVTSYASRSISKSKSGLSHNSDSTVFTFGKDSCQPQHVDGCSIPLGLPFFYKTQFTPSCNKHDVCYRCVSIAFSMLLPVWLYLH